jgi:hypothetical protein
VLKEIGEVVQGFTIDTVIGYHGGEPVYSCTCGGCGVSGVSVKHSEFRRGTAKCNSVSHFAVMKEKLPVLSLPPEPELEPITVDEYVLNLKAARDAENKRCIAVARDQWCSYIAHGASNAWHLDKMLDIKDWAKLPLEHREEILEKQRSGFYEKQKESID